MRFLGEYDNVFLSHADRSRITGNAPWGAAYAGRGAYFVDGLLAGAWRASELEGRATLSVEPRADPGDRTDEVASEGEALLRLLFPDAASREVEIRPG